MLHRGDQPHPQGQDGHEQQRQPPVHDVLEADRHRVLDQAREEAGPDGVAQPPLTGQPAQQPDPARRGEPQAVGLEGQGEEDTGGEGQQGRGAPGRVDRRRAADARREREPSPADGAA